MSRRRIIHSLIIASLASGCHGPLGATTPSGGEKKVASSTYKNVTIDVNGKRFKLKAMDGKELGDLLIVAGGATYHTTAGAFSLPASVLRTTRDVGNGFFRVFAPGYAPKQVWIGQGTEEVLLAPILPAIKPVPLPADGGVVASDDKAISVKIPAGVLSAPQTQVGVSTYQPEIDAAVQQTYTQQRASLLDRLAAAKQGYRLQAACGAPDCLPCTVSEGLGLLISVDGPLAPGTLGLTYDMAPLLRGWDGHGTPPWTSDPNAWSDIDRARARAAATLLASYQCLVDNYGAAAVQTVLAQDHLSLHGTRLSFDVDIPADRAQDGYLQSIVQSCMDLGVLVQVTVVNVRVSDLPAGILPPDTIGLALSGGNLTNGTSTLISEKGNGVISDQGGGIIGNNSGGIVSTSGSGIMAWGTGIVSTSGAGLVSTPGGQIVSTSGSGLVSNNGGNLTGIVRVPFQAEQAKYKLLSFTEWPWSGASVQLQDLAGNPIGTPVGTSVAGAYGFSGMPDTPQVLLVEATSGSAGERAIAPAPGNRQLVAGINPSTTGLASWVAQKAQAGTLQPTDIDWAGYASDVAYLNLVWGQAEALYAATNPAPIVANAVAGLFHTAGHDPRTYLHYVSTYAGDGAAGTTDATGPAARFNWPTTLGFDASGNMIVSDYNNHVLRLVTTGGAVTTIAGLVGTPGSADGPVASATFNQPQSTAYDPAGNLYLCDYGNHTIRRIDTAGNVTTIAGIAGAPGNADGATGTSTLKFPIGLAWHPSGALYVTDRNNLIRKLTQTGPTTWQCTTVAGNATPASIDGTGTAASLDQPNDLAVAANGDLLFCESTGNGIRRFNVTTGAVTTIARSATMGDNDGPAPVATFNVPTGIAVAADGTIYFVELTGNRLRAIDPAGNVRTIAGTGATGFQDDLPGAATFNLIRDVGVDPAGRIFVTDRNNNAVRQVRP
jgi:sugar lactone lactonase YvrE